MMPRTARRARCLTIALLPLGAAFALAACTDPEHNPRRTATVEAREVAPERYLPADIDRRPDSARLVLAGRYFDTDEEGQRDSLPDLAEGMTLQMIRDGDAIFHGKGGCYACHGSEAQGLPKRGKTLTAAPHFVPAGDWNAIDSLVAVGMRDERTRTEIAMPPRGRRSDLDADEMRAVSAYVWAIMQTRGEPWNGGHTMHAPHDWRASARTSIP